ncbi:hypothetical protein [Streptosporangium oxazolinicum]
MGSVVLSGDEIVVGGDDVAGGAAVGVAVQAQGTDIVIEGQEVGELVEGERAGAQCPAAAAEQGAVSLRLVWALLESSVSGSYSRDDEE